MVGCLVVEEERCWGMAKMTVGMAFAVVRERVEGRMRDRLRAVSSRLTRAGVSISNLHTQVGRVLGEESTNRDRAGKDGRI